MVDWLLGLLLLLRWWLLVMSVLWLLWLLLLWLLRKGVVRLWGGSVYTLRIVLLVLGGQEGGGR